MANEDLKPGGARQGSASVDQMRAIRKRLVEMLGEVDELGLTFMVYLLSLSIAELNTEMQRRMQAEA